MNALKQIFGYQGQLVRTSIRQGEPWFCGKDVCDILDVESTQLRRLDDDEKVLRLTQTPGGQQEMVFVNESGLYSLILGSRKPEAKAFKRWITHEVLPALRKTGQYSLRNNPSAILKRHLVNANSLAKGLPKPKQIELRRLAVMAAAEESGADYSAVLAVLEAPEPCEAELPYDLDQAVDLFLRTVESDGQYIIGSKYIHLAPNEDVRICQQLNLNRTLIFNRLEERGLINVSYDYSGICRKKHYTAKSAYYDRRRCVQLALNSFDVTS